MDWNLELLMALRAVLAALLGGLVGLEREQHGQDAGIRTYAAVSLGACTFGLISTHALGTSIDVRIAAQIVSGVGFLGAGVIMKEQGKTSGLTTAATLWTSASIGLAMAFGMYVLSSLTAVITLALLAIHHLPNWPQSKSKAEHLRDSNNTVKASNFRRVLVCGSSVKGQSWQENKQRLYFSTSSLTKKIVDMQFDLIVIELEEMRSEVIEIIDHLAPTPLLMIQTGKTKLSSFAALIEKWSSRCPVTIAELPLEGDLCDLNTFLEQSFVLDGTKNAND